MLAVASLQHVLTRTRATMEAEGARLGLDPFAPVSYTHLTLPTILLV